MLGSSQASNCIKLLRLGVLLLGMQACVEFEQSGASVTLLLHPTFLYA